MEDARLLTDTVEELVRTGADSDLQRVLEETPVEDLADLLEHVDEPIREAVFEALQPQRAGEVATHLNGTVRDELLEDIESDRLAAMVSDLEADEAVVLLEDTDPLTTDAVLRRIAPDEAQELRELLGYEDETAGRAMAFGAPAVREEMTLDEAISSLRERADELSRVQEVWVVDAVGRLLGYLPLDLLLLRPPQMRVAEAMRRDVEFAYTYEDQETATLRAQRSHLMALPIIDARGILRGQITYDRLREIAEEENSEDMYLMVGLSEDESVYSPFSFSLRKRLPWLFVNLGTALLAAWVISFFERTIAAVAVLAALQTIVAGQGGNAGVQTLTITVRALALGELDWRNVRRTFFKEVALGAANGLAIGGAIGLLVWLWQGNPWLGVVIAAAMLFNMLAAALAGYGVPLVMRALQLDPAQASGVFVTTVTDVCGFFFFLGLATLMLPLLR